MELTVVQQKNLINNLRNTYSYIQLSYVKVIEYDQLQKCLLILINLALVYCPEKYSKCLQTKANHANNNILNAGRVYCDIESYNETV